MAENDMTTEMRFQACLTFSNIEPPAQNASFRSYALRASRIVTMAVSMGEGSVSMRLGCSAVTCVTVDLHQPVVFLQRVVQGQYNPRSAQGLLHDKNVQIFDLLTIREQNCTGFHIFA